jgi:hypothetical protein
VRLGVLKVEAAKEAKNDTAAAAAAADVAWDAVEWLHGEVNKVGAVPAEWADKLRTVTKYLPIDPPGADVRLKAAGTRLELLKRLNDVGTPADDLKAKKDGFLAAFDAAARGATAGPDKAKYLAWKAYLRYLRLYDSSDDYAVWKDVGEWKAMWADLETAKVADPICTDAAWVRALVRFMGVDDLDFKRAVTLFETAKKAGTKGWGDKTDEFDYRRRLFDDVDLALAGMRELGRVDGQFRYLAARVRFHTALDHDVALSRDGKLASFLTAGLSELNDALDQKFKDPARAQYMRAMLHEDLAWMGTTNRAKAQDLFQQAIDELARLTAPGALPDKKPEDVLLDLGRARVRKVLFADGGPWPADISRELRRSLDGYAGAPAVTPDAVAKADGAKATTHYWLGRIAYDKREWAEAADELTKADKCLPLYRSDRDLYLALATAQGDYTKLKGKGKVPTEEPGRSNSLSTASTLFALATDLSTGSNRSDLVEGLENFPWRVAAADRARLLLAVAKASAGQPALHARIKKVLDRDAAVFGPDMTGQILRALP